MKISSNYLALSTLTMLMVASSQLKAADESDQKQVETSGQPDVRIVESIDSSNRYWPGSKLSEELDDMKKNLLKDNKIDYIVSTKIFDSIADDICDRGLPPIKLPRDTEFLLSTSLSNENENSEYYFRKYFVKYINPQYLDKGYQWYWTEEIKAKGYRLQPGASLNYLDTGIKWRIEEKASDLAWDFGFVITVLYDIINIDSKNTEHHQFTSCTRYKVVNE